MKLKALMMLVLLCGYINVQAQEHDHTEDEHHHEEETDGHMHQHKNELSIAVGPAWLIEENEIAAGLHLHYIRGLGKKNKLGVGAGFEAIIGDHYHYTITANVQYRIWRGLLVGYAPGVTFLLEPSGHEILFAQHIELGYEFEIGMFHLGPVAELGIDKDELHLAGGIHFGIDF